MDLSQILEQINIWAIPVLLAITLHEAAHAFAALYFGDRTAQMLGRTSLNPARHIDPIGTLAVPLAALALSGFVFGWAKPVPITPQNLRNPKKDMLWIALAGPMANLLMAISWVLLIKFLITMPTPADSSMLMMLFKVAQAGVVINIVLMVFNLLPIPPLDGSRVLMSLLPNPQAYQLSRLEPYGMVIILGLFAIGFLSKIINPMFLAVAHFLYQFFGLK